MKTLLTKNPPEVLMPLANKWLQDGKSFYLGPENIFRYNGIAIRYDNEKEISRNYGSWYICTNDRLTPLSWDLEENEINDISDAIAEHKPISLAMLSVGKRCNANCIMCSYHSKTSPILDYYKNYPDDVDYETVVKRIDKIKAMGFNNLALASDGEIILHPQWKEIYKYVEKLNFMQSFISNGCMFTKDTAEFLGSIKKMGWISFSIHSNRFETWKKILGISNRKYFENAVKAPILAKKTGLPVCVIMVLQDENRDELNEFISYWKNKVDRITILERGHFNARKRTLDNNFPIGLCSQAHTDFLMIETSGIISTCCLSACLISENDSEKYGFAHIDTDSIETIQEKIKNPYRNKNFMQFCKKCQEFKLSGHSEVVYFENGIKGIRIANAIDITN